ncbi:hypothetical protein MNV49_000734 [Pseudohyphozyma bogoriensis]|nr:hypothetical protein MNV49_000734 [Pseudohyphozyma bogoriensis]
MLRSVRRARVAPACPACRQSSALRFAPPPPPSTAFASFSSSSSSLASTSRIDPLADYDELNKKFLEVDPPLSFEDDLAERAWEGVGEEHEHGDASVFDADGMNAELLEQQRWANEGLVEEVIDEVEDGLEEHELTSAELLEMVESVEMENRAGPVEDVNTITTPLDVEESTEATTSTVPPPSTKPSIVKLEDDPTYTGPTLKDLQVFRPTRKVIVPTASSLEAVRIVYKRTYETTFEGVERAFNRQQLITLVGKRGLDLDVTRPEVKAGMPKKKGDNRKGKQVKESKEKVKDVTRWSKANLIRVIMILEWGMPDPSRIPGSNKGKQVTKTVPLTNKTLFLLLAPNSPIVPSLHESSGIKAEFQVEHETRKVSIVLRGPTGAVATAAADLNNFDDFTESTTWELPKKCAAMKPEVFEAVKKLTNVFIEPTTKPDTFEVTALEENDLTRARALVQKAYLHQSARDATPLYAKTVDSPSSRHALIPFSPTVSPPWTTTPSTRFARVRSVDTASEVLQRVTPGGTEERVAMQISKLALKFGKATPSIALEQVSAKTPFYAMKPLLTCFETGNRGQDKERKVELRARFGHVLWPAWGEEETGGKKKADFSGTWQLEEFLKSRKAPGKARDAVFVPSVPPNFLSQTGALPDPSDNSALNRVDALFSIPTLDTALDPAVDLPEASTEPETLVETTTFRRVTYRYNNASTDVGHLEQGIVFEDTPGQPHARASGWRPFAAFRKNLDVMITEASCDAQITMTSRKGLNGDNIEGFREFEATGVPVASFDHKSRSYILDSDCLVQRTEISSLTPDEPTYIYERWTDKTPDGVSGSTVDMVLGKGKLTSDVDWAEIWARGLEKVVGRVGERYEKREGR